MAHNWRAPACYVSVGLVCMLYIWIVPRVGLTDLFAGAGMGAALMWALNDWELRQAAKRRRPGARGDALSLVMSRFRAVLRAARGVEDREVEDRGPAAHAPAATAKPRDEQMHRLAHILGALEESAGRTAAPSSPPVVKTQAPRETPISAWRREVLTRDIERMEVQLRALVAQHEEQPYGAPERPRAHTPRREAPDRWQRPSPSRSASR